MERNRSVRPQHKGPSGAAVMSDTLTRSLYRAFFEDWAEHGFAAISLERVAARAGAGKAAIYRRWPSRLAFASDAVLALGVEMTTVPDRGSLDADILHFLVRLRAVLRHRLVRHILPDIVAEAMRSADMAEISRRVASARREQVAVLLERAINRGELPATLDRSLALDWLPAALYWRMIVTCAPVAKAQLTRQAAAIAAGLRALAPMAPHATHR